MESWNFPGLENWEDEENLVTQKKQPLSVKSAQSRDTEQRELCRAATWVVTLVNWLEQISWLLG